MYFIVIHHGKKVGKVYGVRFVGCFNSNFSLISITARRFFLLAPCSITSFYLMPEKYFYI